MKNSTIANVLTASLVMVLLAFITESDFPVMASNLYTISGLGIIVGSVASIIRLNETQS